LTSIRRLDMPSKNRHLWVGILALLCVVSFQLLNIYVLHMHEDEELSYRATNGDIAFAIHWQTSLEDNQAPGWFVTFAVWRGLVGDSEFASRIMALLLSTLALAITFKLGRRWFGVWGGALALIVLIGNGFYFQYAYDIRPYPMVMLVTALSFWAFDNWLQRNTFRRALIYGTSTALMLYVHYLLVFVVAAQTIYLVLAHRLTLRRIAYGIAAGMLAALLFAPWFTVFVSQVQHLRNVEAASGTGRGAAGIGVSTQATNWATILNLLNVASNGLIVVYGLLIIIGVTLLWRRRKFWLALTWSVLAPAIYLLANTVAAVYAPRFVSHMMLGIGLVVGASIAALELPARWRRIPIKPILALMIVVSNLLTFNASLPVRIPYRDLYRAISSVSQPGDVVLFNRAGEENGYVQYLYRTWMSPELVANLTTDETVASSSRRIWYVTGDLFHQDVQAMFERLEPTHPVQYVVGQCDRAWCYVLQLMQAPPNSEPLVFGGVLSFYGADIELSASRQVDLRLWWRVDDPPLLDYSIGLQLVDAAGTLIAQADGAINHYGRETVQTSHMQPGQIYIDHRTLTLPENASAGTYSLVLVVYQSWDGARLTLTDGSDRLVLDELVLSD